MHMRTAERITMRSKQSRENISDSLAPGMANELKKKRVTKYNTETEAETDEDEDEDKRARG